MKKYDLKLNCPKCGSIDVIDKYDNGRDIIWRNCENCKHQWAVLPLDADESRSE